MNKMVLFFITVSVTVFLTGCPSSPSAVSTSSNTQVSTASANTNMLFEGFWELPNGELFLFQNRAFMLFTPDGELALNGIIFNQTNTRLTLHYVFQGRAMQMIIDHTVRSSDEVNVSNPPILSGIWKRGKDFNAYLVDETATIPFLGYWESEGEDGMTTALHFSPFGFGFEYRFDQNYYMEGFRGEGGDKRSIEITYNPESPTDDFDVVFIIGDSASSANITGRLSWEIDGNDLILGNRRFSRK